MKFTADERRAIDIVDKVLRRYNWSGVKGVSRALDEMLREGSWWDLTEESYAKTLIVGQMLRRRIILRYQPKTTDLTYLDRLIDERVADWVRERVMRHAEDVTRAQKSLEEQERELIEARKVAKAHGVSLEPPSAEDNVTPIRPT